MSSRATGRLGRSVSRAFFLKRIYRISCQWAIPIVASGAPRRDLAKFPDEQIVAALLRQIGADTMGDVTP